MAVTEYLGVIRSRNANIRMSLKHYIYVYIYNDLRLNNVQEWQKQNRQHFPKSELGI